MNVIVIVSHVVIATIRTVQAGPRTSMCTQAATLQPVLGCQSTLIKTRRNKITASLAVAPSLRPRGRVTCQILSFVKEETVKIGNRNRNASSVAVAGSHDPVQELEHERRIGTGMSWS